MRRRRFISTFAAATAASATGCLQGEGEPDDGEPEDSNGSVRGRRIPGIGDAPDGVYHPTHSDPMEMLGTTATGDYRLSGMYTLPHRFWTVTGTRTERVEPTADDSLHLMFAVTDAETGAVVPADLGVSVEVSKDGETVYDRNPWTMLSQRMGFHFGDNVPLDGEGEYDVEVSVGALSDVQPTGALEGRFEEGGSTRFVLELTDEVLQEMAQDVRYFPESRWGAAEALPPMGADGGMEMEGEGGMHGGMPYSSAPPAGDLPGELLGTPSEDDAVFAVTRVAGGSRFSDDDYLLVSPRTPYNRSVLPLMNLETSGGESLSATLDVEAGLHYGAEVADLATREQLEIEVVTPPQVSRHMGYETAFLEMESVTVDPPEEPV